MQVAALWIPDPPLTARQPRQRPGDGLPLGGVSASVDPLLDRIAVLRRDDAHRDQGVRAGERVLVELRWALGDHDPADSEGPPTAHEPVPSVDHLASVNVRRLALGHEVMRLVDNEVKRLTNGRVERSGEVDEPARVLANREAAGVDDDAGMLLGHQPSDRRPAPLGQGDIGMLASDEHDVEACALAVRAEAQAPPCSGRIKYAHLAAIGKQALDDALRGESLAAPGLAENRHVLRKRSLWNHTRVAHLSLHRCSGRPKGPRRRSSSTFISGGSPW